MPGLDGRKMSKSYSNTISLREEPEAVTQEDPHHAHRSCPGAAHRPGRSGEMPGVAVCIGSIPSEETREWVQDGCTSAGIGCLDCKQPVIDAVHGRVRR